MTSEVETAFPERPADANTNQAGQTSTHHQAAQSHDCADEEQRDIRLETHSVEHRQQLEFQDSNLSPGLPLLPTNHEGELHVTEYSLFQQSGNEFVPLRPDPDITMASEKFSVVPQNCTTQASEHGLLSEYPLMQTTLLSEGEISCCSLSQHSVSPANEGRPKTADQSSLSITADRKESPPTANTEPVTAPHDHPQVEAAEDEAFFLNKEITAQHLLEVLQKDIGMLTDSSSTLSSECVVSGSINLHVSAEPKSSQTCKQAIPQAETLQEPPCKVPLSQKQLSDSDSNCEQSWTLPSQDSNISTGPRSTRPDHASEVLHRQLLKESEQSNSCQGESEKQQSLLPAGQSVAPHATEVSQGKPGDTDRALCKGSQTGPFSGGVERSHKERHLWSLGNQTDIDGSYLGFLPQSQSTPGTFKAPSKSSIKAKAEQLSAIESSQSEAGISPQSCDHKSKESNHSEEKAASADVLSLPSVSSTQKVDAWRANQTSGKTSLLDSLELQGISGLPSKKKPCDAVSDTPNHLPSEKVSLQQPLMSVPANQSVIENSSMVPPGSALKRGTEEVMSSNPGENDNTGCSKRPALLSTSSQSSSLSTVMSGGKDQGTNSCAENEENLTTDNVQHDPSASSQPSALLGLGRFSDASADHDLTPSVSQDSNGSVVKLVTSVGTSSVVSLEVDNYAPYWTAKASTSPPQQRSRELNIEERIPLYLQNLGIDQSPSAILTPFVPRGPIREPEFSPTDLCTIKGSIGTPTRSTQTSEGDSPNKGEFSGCSVMSVDSSISIAFSLDSLGPGASVPEQLLQPSTSDPEEMQNQLLFSPQPDEDSYPSTLQTALQQQRDSSLTSSQNTIQVGDRFDSDISLSTEGRESSGSSFRSSRKEFTDTSFVSSKPMLEMCNLLTQAENVLCAGSYVASSVTSHTLSEENIFLSPRDKTMELQEPSFSSSATVEPRSQASPLWAGSSSDSMLTSELRESTADRECMMSPQMPNCPSATTTCRQQENSTVNQGAGSPFVLSQSVRRTEPEGCSAAPPDNTVPSQPAATTSSASGLQQLPPPAVMAADTAEEMQAAAECPEQDITSPPLREDSDQGVMSDGSSGSSLAVKVTKLLQTESPTAVVSTTSSMTDQEEKKAREWIKLKVSGQRCVPLELHEEDRRRIDEIKTELRLRNPLKSQESTDTESMSSSSFGLQRQPDPVEEAETFTTSRDAVIKQTQTLQSLSTHLMLSASQIQNLSRPDLEARIREIAAREGVSLTRTNPQPFTSVTMASRRRSTSPPPSASPAPEPLHLSELSTDTVDGRSAERLPPTTEQQRNTVEAASVSEPSRLLYRGSRSLNSQQNPGIQSRQDATGGHLEEALLLPEDSGTQQDTLTQTCGHEALPGCGSAHEAEEVVDPSAPEPPAPSGHVSHVRLSLSPKSTSHSLTPLVTSPPMSPGSALAPKEVLPVRLRSSASSPEEGVGLASPPEWYRNTEPLGQQAPEREDTCSLNRSSDRLMSQSFTANHRATEAPAPPVLWPYKPKGSEELFYIPQREADVTSSDTTMESTHPGSDDAVPPRFSSDVLGHGDPGISRGVTIRHTEGIYSRRLETSSYQMQEPEERAESTTQTNGSRPLQPSSPAPVARATALMDWGFSPGHFPSYNQSELSHDRFQPISEEVDCENSSHHLVTSDQDLPLPQSSALQSSSTLDQLWERFCTRWNLEDSRPTSNGETSLLERLERLSRLIHNTRGNKAQGTNQGSEEEAQRRNEGKKNEVGATRWRVREDRRTRAESFPSRQAWMMEEPPEPTNDSLPSTCSHGGPHHEHLCPADRDESETVSTSGSISTVDTARLVRAFGSHRVQLLKTSSSLRRLYSTIDKQKARGEQRGGRTEEQLSSITAPQITEDSAVSAESTSSTSTYTLPSHHGPSRMLTAKKAVKVANKGVQAGELELVCDGTRRHTRDVGTTFPSPAESRQSSSSSSSLEGRRGWGYPSKTQRRRKSKKSPSKVSRGTSGENSGVSWFIPAEELRAEGRKENFHEEEQRWRPSTSWFEPYSRIKPWREPLRQRQAPEDKNQQNLTRHREPQLRTKPVSSAPAGLSLQEALLIRRPDFISQSRQRLRRLALQVEARKLQEVFSRRREERFSRPGGAARQLEPAGNTRRAVPRKEMIQRSKQIYNNLPEVRKRREEERRRAQYDSYRLNAQLYNKRITSHVLGRRTAWQ